MSDVPTATLWRCLDAQWIDTDPECDVIALTMRADGKDFNVACAGPKGMRSTDFIPAVRAAAAALIAAVGGDLAMVGASTPTDNTFDTGDQRAN